ncbi:MAG: hypothetical protein H0T53_07320 [Herpetosiphonaceae bacterium]|nr:hypothetical protein [Herpetosiphonaceae bacterium]
MRVIARLGLLLALFILAGVATSSACSLAVVPLGTLVQESAAIVIGTISTTTPGVATLEVEQYLKGGDGEREIALLNHTLDLGPDCSRSLGAGERFAEGTRLLLFLEPNTSPAEARWQPSRLVVDDDAAWAIIDDQISVSQGGRSVPSPLEAVTSQIIDLAALAEPPVDLAQPAPPILVDPVVPPAPPPAKRRPPEPAPALPGEPAASPPSAFLTTTLPWALMVVGVVSGGLALWGWARSRREER